MKAENPTLVRLLNAYIEEQTKDMTPMDKIFFDCALTNKENIELYNFILFMFEQAGIKFDQENIGGK